MNYLVNPLLEMEEYRQILDTVKRYAAPVVISGPSDSQKAHLAYSVVENLNCRGLFVASNELQARKMYDDFSFFFGEDVLFFSSKEVMLYDVEAKSYDAIYQRIRALDRIIGGSYRFIVTSVEAIAHKLIPRELFISNTLSLALGGRLDPSWISEKLVSMGYERVTTVEGMGQFAIRGGIIDIFPVNGEYAVRIELFDDEIDSIRKLDVLSQRSVDKLENARIAPAREVIYPDEARKALIDRIRKDLAQYSVKVKSNSEVENLVGSRIEADITRLENDYYFPGIDRYIPYIIEKPALISDYIDSDVAVFIDEPVRLKQRHDNLILEYHEVCKALMERGHILPGSIDAFFDFETLVGKLDNKSSIYFNTISTDSQLPDNCRRFNVPSRLMGSYQGHIDLLVEDIKAWKAAKNMIIVLAGTRGRGERLVETLVSKGVEAAYFDDGINGLQPGQVAVTHGSLHKGFEYPTINFVVVSDKEVFGQDRKIKRGSEKKKGRKINVFTDLNPGDFVVHQAHGIGQYVGIEKLAVESVKRDYLKIRYQEGDFLYIPTSQLDLIQKYIGSEGKAPRLSKLGGTDWTKTKKKVKESLRELAAELIKLYAQRQSTEGHSFIKDTIWQKQLEEAFTYEETEDQLKCIDEIKGDMEQSKPMDRLLCGDVGYGKTEVALRAVFKAVMDGKQVAYLVPTTILAQQHYTNFKERMKDFPVTTEVLSRFRSKAEQKKILKDVKSGMVDILIGTHRLLQKDIQFKDLGLLVIDEEQRFGVTHKEKLKNFRPNIDVLTLTATPIPRTLHMSLVGIRDISIIEDPPEDRYPVQTYVMEHNPDVIRDAITRELGRKGQVFYLYNRVRSIQKKAFDIQTLVPEARVGVAHGQMDEKELEDIMESFINGEFDVLVCTTIIESGLDMPNVNTIVVEDADRMGLAQLHQLRGRVGRSNRMAYAYITYKKDKVLSEYAEKRLQAIKEFTELGSGFKIAMRDLEIRGAGNLLGPEQHGHMESVGYDMYCRLLDEAVRELKGESLNEKDEEITIDINISAYIDDDYINTEEQKIEMYKKIASIQGVEDMEDITDELVDRYGDMPLPVQNLISIAYIKALARDAGFSSVTEKNSSVVFQLKSGRTLDMEMISQLSIKYKRQLLFNASSNPYLMYKPTGISSDKLLDNIKILLQDVKNFAVQ